MSVISSIHAAAIVILVAGVVLSTGCATSSPEPKVTSPKKVTTDAIDPLGDFNGKRVTVGQEVVLDEFEYGVEGVGIVLKLFKINEQTYTEGGKDTVTTQAEINVIRGEEQKRLLVGEGEGKWAFGCKINVAKARVEYIEKRQDWLPRATVTVTGCSGK